MFPHPLEHLRAANKLFRDGDLHHAASLVGNIHPPLFPLLNLKKFKETMNRQDIVLKRSFADASTMTFMPDQMAQENRQGRTAIMEQWNNTRRYEKMPPEVRPVWFTQPYIPELVIKGEFRAFVVGGKLRATILTTPTHGGGMDQEMVDNFTPLHLIQ